MITHAHLSALEMRTQKRLGEMHETLNKILQQMPEMLGPSRKPTPTSAHGASLDSVIEEAKEDAAARMRKHGTLTVNIMKANNLIKADLLGLSDPYVHIGLPGLPGQPTMRTRTIRSNLNPEWDERIEFEGVLEQFVSSTCRLDLFDQDFRMSDAMRHGSSKQDILSDDKLGWLEFSLSELGTKDSILKNDCVLSGVPHGTITFEVSWSPDSNAGVNTIRSLVEKDRDVKFQLRNLRRAMNAQAEKDRRKAARGMRRQMTLNRSPTQSIHGSPPGGGLQKQSTKMCASPRPASSPLPPPSTVRAPCAFTPWLTFCSTRLGPRCQFDQYVHLGRIRHALVQQGVQVPLWTHDRPELPLPHLVEHMSRILHHLLRHRRSV